MSFFGKLSKKWKGVKHKVDSVASPSHIALNATMGKKKGQAVGDSIDVAVGSAYTFGLGKLAANAGQAAEAKDKYKAAKKAAKKAKKANLLAAKKAKKSGPQYTSGFLPSPSTPYLTTVGSNAGSGSPALSSYARSSGAAPSFLGGLESGLESANRALENFLPAESGGAFGGDDYLTGDEQSQLAGESGNPNGTNPLTFALVAGGILVLVFALKR